MIEKDSVAIADIRVFKDKENTLVQTVALKLDGEQHFTADIVKMPNGYTRIVCSEITSRDSLGSLKDSVMLCVKANIYKDILLTDIEDISHSTDPNTGYSVIKIKSPTLSERF